MSNPKAKRPAPLSIRLSEPERKLLTQRAGDTPLSTYVKRQVFGDAGTSSRAPRAVSLDRALAAQILSLLGETRVSNNLNQIAKNAHTGSLVFDDRTLADLKEACQSVRQVRDLLMQALGKAPSHQHSVSTAFAAVAGPEDRP